VTWLGLVRVCGLSLLLFAACAPATGRRVGEVTAHGVAVTVVTKAGATYRHPAQVTDEDVRVALIDTGYLLPADADRISPDIAREFASLRPDQQVHIERTRTEIELFVGDRGLTIAIQSDGMDKGQRSYPLASRGPVAPTTLPPGTPGAMPPPSAVPSPPPVATAVVAESLRLWTFAVGVSEHRVPSASLQYAAADARALDAFFASSAGGAIPPARRVLLVDQQATRAAILSALTDTAKRMSADDLLVLHLSMHGLPDSGGELYFVAYDTDPRQLVGTGLPQRDVQYALGRSRAKRIVMLVDACHAGATGFAGYGNKRGLVLSETNRLLDGLAATKPGVAVLTASSASESSVEGPQWGGHGVFTHYVLTGLRGSADTNRDGLVSIRELFEFVYRGVSDDTKGDQHPELKGDFDNRMPLATVATSPGKP
jgi:hypothetical protein